MKRNIVLILFSFFVFSYSLYCQETDNIKKNSLTYAPFQLDGTISFSYYRIINENLEFVFNPRIKQNQDAPSGHDTWEIFMREPFWYKRFSLRSGVLFHYENAFFEPMFQYDRGSFNNESRQLENNEGDLYDVFQSEDQIYNSYGLIGLVGYIRDFKYIRIKIYMGIGSQQRYYHRTLHEKTGYQGIIKEPIIYPVVSNYNRNIITIHGGFEIGIRF